MRKYLIPDSNDEIRQEQMREMEIMANKKAASSPGPLSSASITSVMSNLLQIFYLELFAVLLHALFFLCNFGLTASN